MLPLASASASAMATARRERSVIDIGTIEA
jgi:hypothetical protein